MAASHVFCALWMAHFFSTRRIMTVGFREVKEGHTLRLHFFTHTQMPKRFVAFRVTVNRYRMPSLMDAKLMNRSQAGDMCKG